MQKKRVHVYSPLKSIVFSTRCPPALDEQKRWTQNRGRAKVNRGREIAAKILATSAAASSAAAAKGMLILLILFLSALWVHLVYSCSVATFEPNASGHLQWRFFCLQRRSKWRLWLAVFCSSFFDFPPPIKRQKSSLLPTDEL